ncbi:FBP domain-containing protein [Phytomonospora sp. NPDC050363]|uniref:FBP domain-containing protein n=1 Tax=Phytomonospora sp. NPDC050363 TaxID=3155642 RepID=UPI0033F64731
MDPLTEAQIRRSMTNCSRGEADKLTLPGKLDEVAWDRVDFLGWRDPKAPLRSYIVTWRDGEPVGMALRVADSPKARRVSAMCGLCRSTRQGGSVSLFTARRAKTDSRDWNSVGTYICNDLGCSRNARLEKATADTQLDGTLTVGERVAGVRTRLDRFFDEVLHG